MKETSFAVERGYSLYFNMAKGVIELHPGIDDKVCGRFICSQKNYQNVLDFGRSLAEYKNVPFVNYVE